MALRNGAMACCGSAPRSPSRSRNRSKCLNSAIAMSDRATMSDTPGAIEASATKRWNADSSP